METELFAQTLKGYGLAIAHYPVLQVAAKVEPFENGRGFSLRVLQAGKPRTVPHPGDGNVSEPPKAAMKPVKCDLLRPSPRSASAL